MELFSNYSTELTITNVQKNRNNKGPVSCWNFDTFSNLLLSYAQFDYLMEKLRRSFRKLSTEILNFHMKERAMRLNWFLLNIRKVFSRDRRLKFEKARTKRRITKRRLSYVYARANVKVSSAITENEGQKVDNTKRRVCDLSMLGKWCTALPSHSTKAKSFARDKPPVSPMSDYNNGLSALLSRCCFFSPSLIPLTLLQPAFLCSSWIPQHSRTALYTLFYTDFIS